MTREERQRRAAQRKEARTEMRRRELADKEMVAEAMRGVLRSSASSADQIIFAVEVLENLEPYSFVPHNSFSKMQQDEKSEAQRRAFREEFATRHPEFMRELESIKTST